MMTWILVGLGCTGAWTLSWFWLITRRKLGLLPSYQAHFSPKGGCQEALVRELKRARREILVQAYSFTADPLTFALVEAKKRGVNVEVILDHSNEQEKYSDLRILLEHGLIPLIDAKHAIAHNKIMIIDRKILVTGSFNFTNQAENENAENLLILKHHPDLIDLYRANFLMHKTHSTPASKQNLHPAQQTNQRRAA